MICLILILGNFALAFFVFATLYKKLVLPKRCFYNEALIIGGVSSVINMALPIDILNIYIRVLACIVIFLLTFITVILCRFYRDPIRRFDGDKDLLLSPADGRVIYIRKVEKGAIPLSIKGKSNILLKEIAKTDLFNRNCWIIGINMSILDVHTNRAPIAGEVILSRYLKSKFLSLKSADSDTQNERNTIVIRCNNYLVGIIQIASRMVRRIESYVEQGQVVKRGDKIGRIVFGSQVDIILPFGFDLLVKERDYVYAGQTPIAKINSWLKDKAKE